MPSGHRAFLSYAHRYQGWVEVLQRNLEAALLHVGAVPHQVFLDTVDLGSGRSWVAQLQAGVSQAEHMILVMSPEALASPRVEDEWEAFIGKRRDWARGFLHLVRLVDCPLPPFLNKMQWVDFEGHDAAKYRDGLQRLLAGLLGHSARERPKLPPGLEIPSAPVDVLPGKFRGALVSWIAPRLQSKRDRLAIASALSLKPAVLEGHASFECAASALLVEATGADNRAAAAVRITSSLLELFEEDEPDGVEGLRRLKAELEGLHRQAPEAGLLGVYLAQVATDHDRLVPYFQQQAELDLLDRVYVKLELRPEWGNPPGPEEKDPRRAQALGIREVLALSPAEVSWVTGRWVILGDPGAGKTTLLRHLAAGLAREPGQPWVPVLDSLPRMTREREWLLDRIARRMRRAGHAAEGLTAVLDREGQEGRLLLLLDGLDEVPKDDRVEAEALLRDLSMRWPRTPLVVTSRPIGYHQPGSEFRELELLPLDEARRREFLARWFGRQTGEPDEAKAGLALGVLRDDPNLWDLSGNPLYLTLMALLLEQGSSPQKNRGRLYDQVFDLLLGGKHKAEPQPMEHQEAVRRVLRHLGYAMTKENRDSEPVRAIEARLYQPEADQLREPLERVPRWRQGLRPFLDDLAERTGILGPHDGPEADWRFWHRTFREALAAERLEERWKQGGTDGILACAREIAGDESRWAEPYALLTGRLKEPDELVRALVKESPALGLRALATAQGLQEETVLDVLGLTADWKARAEVYRRLLELVGDPDRTLHLIDLLRRQTTNGNDLYFLDLAAGSVQLAFPSLASRAEVLRGRLYDHIQRPHTDLFRLIPWAKYESAPLWRKIPEGKARLGSAARFSDGSSLPKTEATFEEPFVLSAVVVTNLQYRAFDKGYEMHQWPEVKPSVLLCYPAVKVSWFEAVSFCRWLDTCVPWCRGARLPTEVEWEYACRAGSTTRYWSGDHERDLREVGWYEGNSEARPHSVGRKRPNPWGIYDVHGGVWEWTLDEFRDLSLPAPEVPRAHGHSPQTLAESVSPLETLRVMRGGSCWDDAERAASAFRLAGVPSLQFETRGFRVVLPAVPEL